MTVTRRDFVRTAVGVAAVGLGGGAAGMGQLVQQHSDQRRRTGGPVIIASANGQRACNKAMELIRQNADPLDAVVAGVKLVEDDPNDHSVGYGGLPNEDGVVELDACVMHGPTHKAGAVASLRNIRNPSRVATLVMRRTDHVLLVGKGALRFARAHGFEEQEMLTDEARRIWLKWKESNSDVDDWLHPEADEEAARWKKRHEPELAYGTITCMALTRARDLAGCTSTSGLAFKIPGRVGDSPIIGAGLYVDNDVGACGSTGRGEANLQNCSCFMIVEFMRAGMTPQEACLAMLKRVADKTEPRLRDNQGRPNYGLTFYAVREDGLFGGAAMWGVAKMAVHDGEASRVVKLPSLCGDRPEREP